MTLSDRIRACLPYMSESDRKILKDMRERANNGPYKGVLSMKQLAFVETIIARSIPGNKPVQGLGRINEMFDRAGAQLKEPRVSAIVNETELTLTSSKRQEGFVYVQATGGRYVGKLSPQGTFYPVKEAPAETLETLQAFAAEPFKAVVAFGQATGQCGLCRRKLTNPVSVELGIGPICRGRFGI